MVLHFQFILQKGSLHMPYSKGIISAFYPPGNNSGKGRENCFTALGLSLVRYYSLCNNNKPLTV